MPTSIITYYLLFCFLIDKITFCVIYIIFCINIKIMKGFLSKKDQSSLSLDGVVISWEYFSLIREMVNMTDSWGDIFGGVLALGTLLFADVVKHFYPNIRILKILVPHSNPILPMWLFTQN